MSGLPISRRGFPFFLAKPRTALERLRAAAAKEVWAERPIWKRAALVGGMAFGWPTVGIGSAAMAARELSKENEVSFLPSFGGLYAAALSRNVPPHQSSFYQVVLGPEAADMSNLLIPADQRILTRMSIRRGAVLDDAQDKVRFEQICQEHGLRGVPTLASFDSGMVSGEERLRDWPGSVFVKALKGNKGAGAELWSRTARGFMSPDGRDLTTDEFVASFRRQSCLVQPALEDCDALQKLGSVALSSLRVVTAKGKGPATVIAAALSFANKPDSVISHPGTMCGVRVEDGVIVQAGAVREKDRAGKAAEWDALLGARLPFWSDTIALVRKAHDHAFPSFVTLGWDVALTPDGPVLLETNVSWSASQHQIRTGPLGKTALADVIDELLSAPPKDRRSSRRM